jgi:hypothetical protein
VTLVEGDLARTLIPPGSGIRRKHNTARSERTRHLAPLREPAQGDATALLLALGVLVLLVLLAPARLGRSRARKRDFSARA